MSEPEVSPSQQTQNIADGLRNTKSRYCGDPRPVTRMMLDASVELAAARLTELQSELDIWKPMTPDEAEAAYEAAEAVPMSEDEIQDLVQRVTDPAYRPPNTEHVQLSVAVGRLHEKLDECETRREESAAMNAQLQSELDDDTARIVALQLALADLRGLLAWWGEHAALLDMDRGVRGEYEVYVRKECEMRLIVRDHPSLESALRAAREHVAAWEAEHKRSFWE